MKKINAFSLKVFFFLLSIFSFFTPSVLADPVAPPPVDPIDPIDPTLDLGWKIPNIGVIIGFMIKFLFFFAGLAALLYLLLGAFAWVTSSGDKENLKKAQDKIQAAVLGLVILVVVVVILATLEQLVLKNTFCVGLTCTISVPSLL